jgi:small subunit ribosomal protein S20
VQALSGGNESAETTLSVLSNAQSVIDRAANKGVIHKRAAARRKSRLARLVNKMSAAA